MSVTRHASAPGQSHINADDTRSHIGGHVWAALRHRALTLFKQGTSPKRWSKTWLLKAGWDGAYFIKIAGVVNVNQVRLPRHKLPGTARFFSNY